MKNKGITLIALVITIIVLLILAGISIATLTGNNGILTQVDKAKTATTEGKLKELVSIAIGGLQTKNLGDTSKITPEAIAQEVNDNERRTDVTAESSTFPTYIVFEEEKMKVPVDISLNVGDITTNEEKIYDIDGAEDKIAPTDLFDYEVIDEAKVAAITTETLPTKKIKITRIKPEYCNKDGYNPETNNNDLVDTNYGINYKESGKITDTLVIPYQVEYEGEMYTVTEVNLSIRSGKSAGRTLPEIETIIYPNTVRKINSSYYSELGFTENTKLNTIILPNKIKEIPSSFFTNCINLKEINIPNSVTSIEGYAFYGCKGLTNITIPNSVKTIGWGAFYECSNLTNIYCEATSQPSGWDDDWNYRCPAEVRWGQTGHQ